MSEAFNVWAAVRTLRGHIGMENGFGIASRLNPELTREDWNDAIAKARAVIVNKSNELTRNLAAKPRAGEILPFNVKSPGGYIQQVEVFVKDNDTGLIDVRPHSLKTDTLRRRMDVAKEVWKLFQDSIDASPEEYPQTVIGVAYTGTYQLLPKV
jgi:hypothetical protein